MQFITELLQRLRAESPRFFIILRWLFGVLAVLALGIKWAVSANIWQLQYGLAISELCSSVVLIATTVWGTSFLPVKDKIVADTDPRDPPPPKP